MAKRKTVREEESPYISINEWKPEERPRERLMHRGAYSLSNAELLAILISTGSKGQSAVDLCRNLLSNYADLTDLMKRDFSELRRPKGMGNVKAVKLCAAFELAKRAKTSDFNEKKIIKSPDDLAELYIPRFRGAVSEKFLVLLLNSSGQIFREITVSEGLLNVSLVHPREVFRYAITENACSIILLHNHPSGNIQPSKEDINITKQMYDAGKIVDIKVSDHVIIAGENYFSFGKAGLI